jgi:G:T/U-mismatch repair DNA glycosylase
MQDRLPTQHKALDAIHKHKAQFMNTDWAIEEHPKWYMDVSPMQYLILGSFPPHPTKRDYPFFYPNGINRFWKILADLAKVELKWTKTDQTKAVQERYEIMKKLKIGVQNLGLEVKRKGKSALDTNIEITKFHDIISIIETHPELRKILLPGYSAISSTTRSFIRYLQQEGIEVPEIDPIKPESVFKIQFTGRSIDCVVLNSTSTASRNKYDLLLQQFKRNIQ